jgi:hypothetical protein
VRTTWSAWDWLAFATAAFCSAVGTAELLAGFIAVGIMLFCEAFLITIGRLAAYNAYNHGWITGRAVMISALVESGRRGQTMDEWLRGEFERDAMGVAKLLKDKGRPDER